MHCPNCSNVINSTNVRFCNHCGAPVSQGPTVATTPHVSVSAVPAAHKYIRTNFDVQLREAPKGAYTNYYTSHEEIYAVVDEQNGWYKLWLGGNQTGWLEAKECADIANITGNLSVPIPAILTPRGDTYVWATFEPMPLAQIAYDSRDYGLMYQWIGSYAAHPPAMTGHVRSCQQTNTQQFTKGTSVRQSDYRVDTYGHTTTVYTYQMTIEDARGARRTVMFEQPPITILPQVGDYLVVWGLTNQNGVYTMVQGIRRDVRDPSNGSVLVPLSTVARKGPPFNWIIVLIILAVILGPYLFIMFVQALHL